MKISNILARQGAVASELTGSCQSSLKNHRYLQIGIKYVCKRIIILVKLLFVNLAKVPHLRPLVSMSIIAP